MKIVVVSNLWIILILGIIRDGSAQSNDYFLDIQYGKGVIIRHSPNLAHLVNTNPTYYELNLKKKLNKGTDWASLYKYPTVNYGLSYYNLDNPILGDLLIGSIALDIPMVNINNFKASYRLGTGIVYGTNPYDREDNNQNLMISSPITYLLQTRLSFSYKVTNTILVSAALNFSHASNASISKPNKGINIASVNIGAAYKIAEASETIEDLSVKGKNYFQKEWVYDLTIGGGLADNSLGFTSSRPFFNLYADAVRKVNRVSDFEFGLQYYHSLALRRAMRYNWFNDDQQKQADFRRVGISAGHSLKFGKLSLLTALGYYLYNKTNTTPMLYQRLGLEYAILDQFRCGFTLKSHRGVAEFGEFTIGWRI